MGQEAIKAPFRDHLRCLSGNVCYNPLQSRFPRFVKRVKNNLSVVLYKAVFLIDPVLRCEFTNLLFFCVCHCFDVP